MQKYHVNHFEQQPDGALVGRAWSGTLAVITDCRIESLIGDMRRKVYATGEADTFFSIPAVTKIGRKRVRGYITGDDNGNLVFRHTYY